MKFGYKTWNSDIKHEIQIYEHFPKSGTPNVWLTEKGLFYTVKSEFKK
jgi:hypothetical protein